MHDHATDGSPAAFNRAATARELRLHLDNAHDARTSGWDHARLAESHRARHMAEAERLAGIEAAANLVAERLAAAPPAVVDSVLAENLWVPQEAVDVVRDALLAEVEPMSFSGKACFILDALAAAGYEVKLSERSHRASDPPGEASGVGAVDAPPAAPSSTAAPGLLAGAAVDPNANVVPSTEGGGALCPDQIVGGGEPPSPCPAEWPAPSGPIRGEWTI